MATLEERLASLEGLPSPPESLMRVLMLLRDAEVDLGELKHEVVQDQALSLLVLRAANSSVYGGLERVADLREAMTRLGTAGLRRLITAHHGANLMSQAGRGYGLDAESARSGALAGAIAAEHVADGNGAEPEVAFTAGLLRDCGKLVLDHLIGVERLQRELTDAEGDQMAFEQLTYGFDHAEAGSALAKSWGLPDSIALAIAHHHAPPEGNDDAVLDAVYVGNLVSTHLGLGVGLDGLCYSFHEAVLERAGVDRDRLISLIAQTAAELAAYELNP